LANISSSIDVEDLKLVFESSRIWGRCPGGYEIIDTKEYHMDDDTKIIVLEYSNIERMLISLKLLSFIIVLIRLLI
jgi:hypothetical protein